MPRSLLATFCLVFAQATGGGEARCQSTSRWPTPQSRYSVDFRSEKAPRRAVFFDEGAGFEIDVEFMMIGLPLVTIAADLPEHGRFEVEQANAQALVDLRNVRTDDGRGSAEVVARLRPMDRSDVGNNARESLEELWKPVEEGLREESKGMSVDDLTRYLRAQGIPIPKKKNREEETKEIRQAYLDHRTLGKLAPQLKEKLKEIVADRPVWATAKEIAAWETASPQQLCDAYLLLTESHIMDEYLQRVGLGFDSNVRGYRLKLETRMEAVYLVVNGNLGQAAPDAGRVSKVLGPEDLHVLRESLRVELRCRFFPEVDPEDANALWLNAQRVGCRARGVVSIRVEGNLDPSAHDRVDWWVIEGYDPGSVRLELGEGAGYRVDPPFLSDETTLIRVVATGDQAASYQFVFRPTRSAQGDAQVVVHESSPLRGVSFPY